MLGKETNSAEIIHAACTGSGAGIERQRLWGRGHRHRRRRRRGQGQGSRTGAETTGADQATAGRRHRTRAPAARGGGWTMRSPALAGHP